MYTRILRKLNSRASHSNTGITKETKKSGKDAITAANWVSMNQRGYVGTPGWMAPEMMKKEVQIGPSADIYSFGVVMWEVCSRKKPWSELSDKQEIFKAVRDEKRMLKLYKKSDDEDVPSGYEDLMKRCLEYIASRRPLIDVVRVDLQGLMEIAAEIDRDHHRNSTTMMTDNGVETKKEEVVSDDRTTSGVHIEMGTISSTAISSSGSGGDKKDEPEILLEI